MDGTVIFAYTREQALSDGALVDVSEMAAEAGFGVPVAVTRALWADIETIPASHAWQDVNVRLWDVLWMASCAIRMNQGEKGADRTMLRYRLILATEAGDDYIVKLVSGPGDAGEHVITLMKPDED